MITYWSGCNYSTTKSGTAISIHTCSGCFYFSRCNQKHETQEWSYNGFDHDMEIIRSLQWMYKEVESNAYNKTGRIFTKTI